MMTLQREQTMDNSNKSVYVMRCSPDVAETDTDSEPIPDLAKAMHALTLFMSIPRRVAIEVIESAKRCVLHNNKYLMQYLRANHIQANHTCATYEGL